MKRKKLQRRIGRHEAYQHNIAPRLEGVVKNVGIKAKRKAKKLKIRTPQKEAERYVKRQLEAWEEE